MAMRITHAEQLPGVREALTSRRPVQYKDITEVHAGLISLWQALTERDARPTWWPESLSATGMLLDLAQSEDFQVTEEMWKLIADRVERAPSVDHLTLDADSGFCDRGFALREQWLSADRRSGYVAFTWVKRRSGWLLTGYEWARKIDEHTYMRLPMVTATVLWPFGMSLVDVINSPTLVAGTANTAIAGTAAFALFFFGLIRERLHSFKRGAPKPDYTGTGIPPAPLSIYRQDSVRIVELRRVDPADTSHHEHGKHVDWSHRWEVKGHKRTYRRGRPDEYTVHIQPYVKGPKDKPLIRKQVTYHVSR